MLTEQASAPLQRQAEEAGAVQSGEEKVMWKPHGNLPVSEGDLHESWRGTLCQEV